VNVGFSGVFDFSAHPRAYVLSGPLGHKLDLNPQVYTAMPNVSGTV
jgi:hypothetical protein